MADSSGRRNRAYVAGSKELVQSLGRCSPAQGPSRPGVEGDRHGRKVLGAVRAEVGALREGLAQQPVGVLVRAALPGAVGIAEGDLKTGLNRGVLTRASRCDGSPELPRSSRRATKGRPGEGNAPRPDRSERRFRTAIATSSLKVLRRPLEPKQYVSIRYTDAGRGGRVRRLSLPRLSGWTGSTTAGCSSPSATCRRPKPKRATMLRGRCLP